MKLASGWTHAVPAEEAACDASLFFVFLCVGFALHKEALVSRLIRGLPAQDSRSRSHHILHSVYCVAPATHGYAFPLGRCPAIVSASSSFKPRKRIAKNSSFTPRERIALLQFHAS